ncbi:chloride channel protein ClC-Kb-like isoform X2 [Schistocerca gregaria]|uniref:chloride channel protein ClC-Kb-like isoform X2 n=1 Tax=Schistocerca gregaria TaxID=7010 RepID=UPI00211E8A54|nr:chloride channel protein ClC-Kb-like isoform X2 [Schistocerca gregaria]
MELKELFEPVKKSQAASSQNAGSILSTSSDEELDRGGIRYDYEQTIYGSFYQNLATRAKRILEDDTEVQNKAESKSSWFSTASDNWYNRPIKWIYDCMGKLSKNESMVLIVVVSSLVMALINFLIDLIVWYVRGGIGYLTYLADNFWIGYLVYVINKTAFCFFSLHLTHLIEPNAVGSGLPEMKCILSGVTLKNYLSMRTFVAKFLGVTSAICSVTLIGKQSACVHMTSCIVNFLSSMQIFRGLGADRNTLMQLLSAACAIGISVNHGASIGGVLFSIEVTSIYYPLHYYWIAFVASIGSALVSRVFTNTFWHHHYLESAIMLDSSPREYQLFFYEWFIIAFISVLLSLIGVLFVRCNVWIVQFRRRYAKKLFILGPFFYTIGVGVLCNILLFPNSFVPFMDLDFKNSLTYFSNVDLIILSTPFSAVTHAHSTYALLYFSAVRFVLLLLIASTAIPVGVHTANMTVGAALGLFVGRILHAAWPNGISSPHIYSIIGCCAYASSTTQTMSTALLLIELTGEVKLVYPILLSVVIAVGISHMFTVNYYDSLIIIRHLPYLPNLKRFNANKRAKDIMSVDICPLYTMTSLKNMKQLLDVYASKENIRNLSIPIVENEKNVFVGSTQFDRLYSFYKKLHNQLTIEEQNIGGGSPGNLDLSEELYNLQFKLRPRLNHILFGNSIQCASDTPISVVHVMFATLHIINIFVVDNGTLLGVITMSELRDALQKKDL